jgi:hypothetical protein
MKRAMKLDLVGVLVAIALVAPACASSSATAPASSMSSAVPVGTTTLRKAELTDSEEMPRVGKSRRSLPESLLDEGDPKDAPQRRTERHPGGGFSGYK